MNKKAMKFYKKYRHVGASYPSVPDPWKPIVERAIIDIEKIMWPQRWLPMCIKRLIHYLATGNSIVRIKYRWAYWLRTKLTGGRIINDIKDKYAGLRIYHYGCDKIEEIVNRAEKECDETCEFCGSNNKVIHINFGWIYNLCGNCIKEHIENKCPWVDITEFNNKYIPYVTMLKEPNGLNEKEFETIREDWNSFLIDNSISPN